MDWTDYPVVALALLLVFTNVGLVAAMSSSDTSHGPFNGEWNGGTELRQEAAAAGADVEIARSTRDYTATDAPATAFVRSPQDRYVGREASRVRQFASRGGTVVVAGERGTRNATNALLAELDVESRLGSAPVRDEQRYYRNASLPRATNVSDHPLVADVEQLTLNRGTVVNVSEPSGPFADEDDPKVVVRTGTTGYLDENDNGTLDDTEALGSHPIAVVEPIGDGRVVVVSDASVFTNAMLEQGDNRAFARALVGDAETVLLDYSHRPAFPPLTYALLVLRDQAVVQTLLGLGVLGAVALWMRRPAVPNPVPERFRASGGGAPDVELDEEEVAALLRERHPDWDPDRIERVSQTIRRQRREG